MPGRDTVKRALYSALLWLTEWDLDFARATGRNQECIQNLSARAHEHAATICRIDHPLEG